MKSPKVASAICALVVFAIAATSAPAPHHAGSAPSALIDHSHVYIKFEGKYLLCLPVGDGGHGAVPRKFVDCVPAPDLGFEPSAPPLAEFPSVPWQVTATCIGVGVLLVSVAILLSCEVYDRCIPWEFGGKSRV